MAKKLYEETNISAIAAAIRSKNGSQDTYTTAEMADAIEDIETGGILVTKSISENGTYNALLDDDADGYSQVTVNVPSGGGEIVPAIVTPNSVYATGFEGDKAFGTEVTNWWGSSSSSQGYLKIDFINPVKITRVRFHNTYIQGTYHWSDSRVVFQYSDDGSAWVDLFDKQNLPDSMDNEIVETIQNPSAHRYYRFLAYPYDAFYTGLGRVQFDITGAGGRGTKEFLYEINESQGNVWINTEVNISNFDTLLFEDIFNGDVLKEIIVDISDIAVYTGGADVYTNIHSEHRAMNARIYNDYLYVSYNGSGSANYATKIYKYSEGSGSDDWQSLKNYIESSGTQYIDTGYVPNDNSVFEVITSANATQPCQHSALFGARPSSSSRVDVSVIVRNVNSYPLRRSFASVDWYIFLNSDQSNHWQDRKTLYLHKKGYSGIQTNDGLWFSMYSFPGDISISISQSIYIFCINQNGSSESNSFASMKLYRFRIFEGETLVHEFIPWQDNGVACLKDTVTGNIKYNAGTGDFVYGTDS